MLCMCLDGKSKELFPAPYKLLSIFSLEIKLEFKIKLVIFAVCQRYFRIHAACNSKDSSILIRTVLKNPQK